jgi:hypothetical protein
MSELLSNILDAAGTSFRHLGNMHTETLALAVGAVAVAVFLLFRR